MKSLFSKTTATVLLATSVVAGGMVSSANAAGFSGATCDVTDIMLTDGSGAAADACAGSFEGNDSQGDAWSTQLNDNDIFGDYLWSEADKIDTTEGAQTLSSNFFKISQTDGWNVGTIQFLQDIDSQFALTLKASTFWSAYSFDSVTAGEIFNFDTAGVAVKNNGGTAALSHASLYISDNAITSNPQEVPEPTVIGGLLMLGAGLATSRRRKA